MDNPAAWHPDPTGRHDHRWWDGERWTEHVADGGVAGIDHLDAGPGAAAGDTETSGDTGWAGGDTDADRTDRVWASPASDEGPGRPQPDGGSGPAAQGPDATAQGPDATAQGSGAQPPAPWAQQQPAGGGWGQQPGWPQAGSAGQAPQGGVDGLALTAMIVGILSLLIAWIPFLGILGAIGGVVAVILGFVGRGRVKSGPKGGSGQALTGIITGAIAIVLAIAVTVGFARLIDGNFGEVFADYAECIEETNDPDYCEQLLEDDLIGRFGS